jgi:hypothetical protein
MKSDSSRTRELLLELRGELNKAKPSRETALAFSKLDELQQVLWQVGIQERRGDGLVVTPEMMRERAKAALLEVGNNSRGAEVIINHLIRRGIIDSVNSTWRSQ